MKKILITGGAGFIGSHLADELLNNGYHLRIIDNLNPQVHGYIDKPPHYLSKDAEFIYGDVRNPQIVNSALKGIDAVFHLAAAVGVGQSMYEIEKYTSNNSLGTAVLCQCIIDNHQDISKFIVASSMSIYGEGQYINNNHQIVGNAKRTLEQLKKYIWEPFDTDGTPLQPIPTNENKQPDLTSIYALTKYDQERMCIIMGNAYNIPTVALRFFNVYGTRQSLSNPYTGVLAIFASRLLNGNTPLVFEDGNQKRDFINVKDIARACRLVLENPITRDKIYNIGSGNCYTIKEIAELLSSVLNKNIEPVITRKYRVGDIRHCFADIRHANSELGFSPQINLEQGLTELSQWLAEQISTDEFEKASQQLIQRGLTI
ncbi:MAG: nucleoside-diphosphate-sugar epimerase [Planctomycetes bacterium GWF2_41_51]|nr:MAG: nucleoside-diphosphate-sugar epimerase [Planctomycetes bacterium GWF2_41_51]HBG27064.1 nucleoside-diphosphate-sugar epimerase [Phycisphaerales bacterium]